MGPLGFEPRTNRLCLPTTTFVVLSVCGLDCLFSLRGCRTVSTPSSKRLGSGSPSALSVKVSPNLASYTYKHDIVMILTHNYLILIGSPMTENRGVCCICESELSGQQKKFCSNKCKAKLKNNKYQNYAAQQLRGSSRRLELIKMYGGKCQICGYARNSAGLCFHHQDPKLKKFRLDVRNCSNRSWKSLMDEAKKCDLLCHCCHAETHFPEQAL